MNMKKVSIIALLVCATAFAQQKGTFTDSRDGKKYKYVTIGEQTWMAENLNFNAKDSKCYDNKESNCQQYGRLYNFNTAKAVCPSGWHLPSNAEFRVLESATGTEGKFLKTVNGWNSNSNGTDAYGFSALPGGFGNSSGNFNVFETIGDCGYWWDEENNATLIYGHNSEYCKKTFNIKEVLFSVRCVKNTFTDPRDGKKYKYVTIGTQTWMAENLDYAGNDDIGTCYDRKPKNCEKYGALYTKKEAMKVCPAGWHLPNDGEWLTLIDFAGGNKVAGKKLKAKSDWKVDGYKCKYTTKETTSRGKVIETEHDECATDEFGFAALPNGLGNDYGHFLGIGENAWWWSTYKQFNIYYNKASFDYDKYTSPLVESHLLGVRCVKDSAQQKNIAKASVDMTPCGEYGKRFTYFRQSNEYMYEYCQWFIWKGHYDAKTGKLLTYKPTISEYTYQHIRDDFCTVIPEWGESYVDEECFRKKVNYMKNIFFPKLFDHLKEYVNIYRAGYENLGD